MSWLSNILGGGKNPADSAMPYLNQIPDTLRQYFDPYAQTGLEAKDRLSGEYDNLLSDPQSFINALMSGYEESDAYKGRRDEALEAAGNSAAAGGFSGTPIDQKRQADMVNSLLSQDQQQYLQNALGAYGLGLQGEQGLFNTGYNAANQLGGGLANLLQSQGSLAFQGQSQQNTNQNALLNSLLGGAAKAIV